MLIGETQFQKVCDALRASPRERQVLRRVLAADATNRDIAAAIGASIPAVNTALRVLYLRTGGTQKHQLVLHVLELAKELRLIRF